MVSHLALFIPRWMIGTGAVPLYAYAFMYQPLVFTWAWAEDEVSSYAPSIPHASINGRQPTIAANRTATLVMTPAASAPIDHFRAPPRR